MQINQKISNYKEAFSIRLERLLIPSFILLFLPPNPARRDYFSAHKCYSTKHHSVSPPLGGRPPLLRRSGYAKEAARGQYSRNRII